MNRTARIALVLGSLLSAALPGEAKIGPSKAADRKEDTYLSYVAAAREGRGLAKDFTYCKDFDTEQPIPKDDDEGMHQYLAYPANLLREASCRMEYRTYVRMHVKDRPDWLKSELNENKARILNLLIKSSALIKNSY